MRATHHFHRGLLLSTLEEKKKEFERNTLKSPNLKEVKQEREKLFTRESSQQVKEEREIFLGFLLILQLNYTREKI